MFVRWVGTCFAWRVGVCPVGRHPFCFACRCLSGGLAHVLSGGSAHVLSGGSAPVLSGGSTPVLSGGSTPVLSGGSVLVRWVGTCVGIAVTGIFCLLSDNRLKLTDDDHFDDADEY